MNRKAIIIYLITGVFLCLGLKQGHSNGLNSSTQLNKINELEPTLIDGVATFSVSGNIGVKRLVPNTWKKIVIKKNVTLIGSFFMPDRTEPIEIAGESRVTSVLRGNGTRPTDDGIKGRSYSAIRCDKSPDVYIHDLRITEPMKFHIHAGFGNLTVERCDIIAGTETYTTDGIHGGVGKTVVKDCFIDVFDDALYTVECKLIENTTIIHNKNGSPFMTSWGNDVPENHVCVIRNCTVEDNYNGTNYNHGVIAWAGKKDAPAQTLRLKFEGTFNYSTRPGKQSSQFYTIGRVSQKADNNPTNAHIIIDGFCKHKTSINYRKSTNSSVTFINCLD